MTELPGVGMTAHKGLPPGFDTSAARPAPVYDYWPGGPLEFPCEPIVAGSPTS
jgi:hypothetical protein